MKFSDYLEIARLIAEADADDRQITTAIQRALGGDAAKAEKVKAMVAAKAQQKNGPRKPKAPETAETRTLKNRIAQAAKREPNGSLAAISAAINEAKEYVCVYMPRGSTEERECRIKGRDARDVKDKFAKDYHGVKLLTVEPAQD